MVSRSLCGIRCIVALLNVESLHFNCASEQMTGVVAVGSSEYLAYGGEKQ